MIRYHCPHCQRICETSEALRGFAVYCLGCRQPTKVPNESSIADEIPVPRATTRPAAPEPPPPRTATIEPQTPVKQLPAIDVTELAPRPVEKPRLTTIAPPKPVEHQTTKRPNPSGARNRIVSLGLVGVVLSLVVLGGVFGWNWYSKRKQAKQRSETTQELESQKKAIRDNFSTASLKKLSDKVPKWTMAITSNPTLNETIAVLSFVDERPENRPFWRLILAAYKLDFEPPDHYALLSDLLSIGAVDDLMFELPEDRWAGGIGDCKGIIGIRWRKENIDSASATQRWKATLIALDRAAAKVIGRIDISGKPPSGGKTGLGPKPLADVLTWIEKTTGVSR